MMKTARPQYWNYLLAEEQNEIDLIDAEIASLRKRRRELMRNGVKGYHKATAVYKPQAYDPVRRREVYYPRQKQKRRDKAEARKRMEGVGQK